MLRSVWHVIGGARFGVALLLACALPADSEAVDLLMTDEYAPLVYGKHQGLPDQEIRDMLQSRDGSLWIVTQGGLARFDGTKFTVYDHANTPELGNDEIFRITEDTEGNLWIGGQGFLLRKSGNSFRRWTAAEGWGVGHCITQCGSRSGGIWTAYHSIERVHEGEVTRFGPERGVDGRYAVFALQEDAGGILWAGTHRGLLRLDPRRQIFEEAAPWPQSQSGWIPTLALHLGPTGRLWAMFVNNEKASFLGTNAWVEWRKDGQWGSLPSGVRTNFQVFPAAQFILEDRRGNVWLSGYRDQIHRLRGDHLETLGLKFPGGTDGALCLCEDYEGNLWMGTGRSGLWRWQARRIRSFSKGEGLPNEDAWAVCEGADGSVWVATDGGVSRCRDGIWKTWTMEDGLCRTNVRALAAAPDGTVWIGTSDGLNSWREGVLKKHTFPGEWFNGKIRALLSARDGTLWVGTPTGVYKLKDDQRTKLTTAEGLARDDVRALLEDSAGRVWIGTFGGGVQCLEAGRFKTYSTTNGLSSGFVWALHEDHEGTLWVGTESGLNRLRQDRVTTYGKEQGLPDNLVNSIVEDDLGQLWISHDRGIYRVKRAALNELAAGRAKRVACVSYTEADGLPSEETNGQKSYPAACRTRDGRLWFATTRGVAVIDPRQHREEESPPRASVEQVRANGKLVLTQAPQDPLAPELPIAHPLRGERHLLPPGSGHVLEVLFTANTFVSPDKTRFRYRLLGLDEKWMVAGTRRQAFFANLKPGDYRFEVVAISHQGVAQETGAGFSFVVAPFLYETWWFYVLTGILIASLVGGAVLWRVCELQRIHALESRAAIDAERLRMAKDLHDGLGADLTRLAVLADLASAKDGRESLDHLRKLSRSSREAARELRDVIWIASPANDTVDRLVSRICHNAEDFLRDAGIRCRFDLPAELPERPLTQVQRRNLLLASREATNNIVKHSQATEAKISIRSEDNGLEIVFADNGKGFDRAAIPPGTLGLESMRRRVENPEGAFALESQPGKGTTVRLRIQFNNVKDVISQR